ncbi:nuclear distribution protein nudE-like 1-B isoform X2 [Cherax quadricarinatus]|uniref:nuclear distribution protein nudE-like 1-B isoform X2 n=1 Tax=Cherax quadricarinatus TaxID=27406 RepID=UPI0023796366|nr:nuclear distribution protein nudE-like 1-B isoform X1 [Cherax quadricarinatus]
MFFICCVLAVCPPGGRRGKPLLEVVPHQLIRVVCCSVDWQQWYGLEETREELEEFQSGSRELEAELEAQLEQTETRCSEYQSQLNRLALENDSLKESPVLIETRQTLSQWSI